MGPAVDAGWTAHIEACPDCREMQRRHARLIAALQHPGRIRGPRADWQGSVFRALESRQQPASRKIRLRWLTATCMAIAIALVAWFAKIAHDRVVSDEQHEPKQLVLRPSS